MYVRLQLLLDHRDARPQFPRLAHRARHRRHPRCPRSRRARRVPRRRQHHVERRALRRTLRRDRGGRPERSRLRRAGHDECVCVGWRRAGRPHARRGLPLRVPRYRERGGGRSRLSARERQERRAAGRAHGRQRDHPRGGAAAPARHARRRRPHRRQSGRHTRVDRGESGLRATLRRLAVHPAPHAVPRHADDPGLPCARPRRIRRRHGVRRNDGCRAHRAHGGRGGGIHALARRAVDEGAAPAPCRGA